MQSSPAKVSKIKSAASKGLLLLGANGMIGSALLTQSKAPAETLSWAQANKLSPSELKDTILELTRNQKKTDIIFANGLTNPALSSKELFASNFEFPKNVIEALLTEPKFRFLTLGSVHEAFPRLCEKNPYLSSKLKLSEYCTEFSKKSSANKRLLHVRLHTVFGPPLKDHMFLGQVYNAIRTQQPFRMSSGDQLREYQAAQHVGQSIQKLLDTEWDMQSVFELSYGTQLALRELAQKIFQDMNCSHLLQINAIERSPFEVLQYQFQKSPNWLIPSKPDPVPLIVEMFRNLLRAKT